MDYAIHFGALSESVEEQLKEQGYTLGDSASYINDAARYGTYLYVYGFVTDAEFRKINSRIMKHIKKNVKVVE